MGIFAIDLNDRIESWNAQMEAMYSFQPRQKRWARSYSSVFPAEFIEALGRFRAAIQEFTISTNSA